MIRKCVFCDKKWFGRSLHRYVHFTFPPLHKTDISTTKKERNRGGWVCVDVSEGEREREISLGVRRKYYQRISLQENKTKLILLLST